MPPAHMLVHTWGWREEKKTWVVCFKSFVVRTQSLAFNQMVLALNQMGLYVLVCGLPPWLSGKESACNAGTSGYPGSTPGLEELMEEGMATHSSILTWRIPWTEEPGCI